MDNDLKYTENGEYTIRILTPEDVTNEYVKWISDPEITRYSQNRLRTFTLEGQKKYVKDMLDSDCHYLYGLFHHQLHIGNLLFGPIDWFNKLCDVRIVIGYKKYWGKGIMYNLGTKGIENTFKDYPLFKLCITVRANNLPSIFCAKKFGFVKEGIRKSHLIFEDSRIDLIEYGVFVKYGKVLKNYVPD